MTRRQIIIITSVVLGIGLLIGAFFLIRYFQARNLDPVDVPPVSSNEQTPTSEPSQNGTSEEIQRELDILANRPKDTDGDGLTDDEEAELGTNPEEEDTDEDGYSDYEEVRTFNQDPLSPDEPFSQRPTPEEAIRDRMERTGEEEPNPDLATPVDSDNDGLSDEEEAAAGTDASSADSDQDGLTDGDEVVRYRTDPTNPDSDGDGFFDGQEVSAGFNPLGPGECANPDCLP